MERPERKIFIIGTIHGHTPPEELREVLEELELNQLMIELPEDAPEKFADVKDIRDEMMFAYRWAGEKKIPVCLFDQYQPLFADGYSPDSPEYKELISGKPNPALKEYSWKEFNKSEISAKLDTPLSKMLFDPKKAEARELKMLAKIKENMLPKGNTGIVTGTSHLDFFKTQLPGSIAPLR